MPDKKYHLSLAKLANCDGCPALPHCTNIIDTLNNTPFFNPEGRAPAFKCPIVWRR